MFKISNVFNPAKSGPFFLHFYVSIWECGGKESVWTAGLIDKRGKTDLLFLGKTDSSAVSIDASLKLQREWDGGEEEEQSVQKTTHWTLCSTCKSNNLFHAHANHSSLNSRLFPAIIIMMMIEAWDNNSIHSHPSNKSILFLANIAFSTCQFVGRTPAS